MSLEDDIGVADRQTEPVMFPVAVIVGVLFGGADQYLGSRAAMPWAASVSLLSAPWLLVPFCFGWTQGQLRRAVIIGLVVTYSALLGYSAMGLTPLEGVHISQQHAAVGAVLHSERRFFIGGLFTGPLYGALGHYWREKRAWISAVLVAGAVCLEPFAERVVGQLPRQPAVWLTEIATGVVLSIYFLVTYVSAQRASLPRF